ncbi:hypothetical protein C1I97_09515 [Streptomyces sp. NTH33]|uniref:ABC transporter permease n=1 Tax=Streptomyces sp. NTH33 TaxID=1735453 RepID=UPI000DA7D604|nr:ABC transporter permease [Streptomyces sp. NTH33]PZH14907.1 hypothetical protein C1I97_09515 [Streptomyces sp. NTH33]
MLTTLLRPTGGTATVAGCDLVRDPVGVRRACGYVARSGGVDGQISVREELVIQGRMYRLTRQQARSHTEELARELDLAGLLARRTSALSGGRRRRLGIAMALIHRPRVLAPAMGLRAPPPGVLIGFGFVALLTISLASLSYAPAMRVRTAQEFGPVINALTMPPMLLSGLMLPMALGPAWRDVLSRLTPFRYPVDAVRDAYVGSYASAHMLYGVLVAAGFAALPVLLGTRVFRTAGA